jgi:hypothetical protein
VYSITAIQLKWCLQGNPRANFLEIKEQAKQQISQRKEVLRTKNSEVIEKNNKTESCLLVTQ